MRRLLLVAVLVAALMVAVVQIAAAQESTDELAPVGEDTSYGTTGDADSGEITAEESYATLDEDGATLPDGTRDNFNASAAGLRSCTSASFAVTEREYRLARQINRERAERGVAKMCVHKKLVKIARQWSAHMANNNVWAHGCYSCRANAVNYNWQRLGEILCRNTDGQTSGCVSSWLGSSSHRSVMLDGRFKEMGTGIKHRSASPSYWYYTVDVGARQ